MSFQDLGGSSRTTSAPRPAATTPLPTTAAPRPVDAIGQISETLLQYQRNVGILEKIVQSLLARPGSTIGGGANYYQQELQLQYKAQVDVIGQLEDKVRRQLQQQQQLFMNNNNNNSSNISTGTQRTTLIKLQRDFERVQALAQSWQLKADRMLPPHAGALSSSSSSSSHPTTLPLQSGLNVQDGPHSADDQYQRIQLQLQQDRLNEEIMREREEEIRKINRGMHQVNEIYKDLAHIVSSQQEQVDTIESQMEESKANAEAGLKQVEKANEKYGQNQCAIS